MVQSFVLSVPFSDSGELSTKKKREHSGLSLDVFLVWVGGDFAASALGRDNPANTS